MFHTFEGFENPDPTTPARSVSDDRRQSTSRRVTTQRACTSCRHRKIKCDGEKPCEACRWYKKAEQCYYPDPRPSRRFAPLSRWDNLAQLSDQACGEIIHHHR
jgi:hypothetical protein